MRGRLLILLVFVGRPQIFFQRISYINLSAAECFSFRFGPRFPAMNKAYNLELRKVARDVAKRIGLTDIVREGVYAVLGGPNFETIAELRMLKNCGADAVGMLIFQFLSIFITIKHELKQNT